ncbi:hypothetical protein ACFL0I_04035 [Gemmatimonadota bacterium]
MSRPAWILGIMIWSSLLAGAGEAAAQATSVPTLEEVGARIQELRPQVDEAKVRYQLADSAQRDSLRAANQIPLDTLFVGPLRIITIPGQEELAREIFDPILAEIEPLLRGSEEVLRGHTVVFRYAWRLEGMYVDGYDFSRVEMSRRYPRRRLEEKARDNMGRILMNALPQDAASLRAWAGGGSLTWSEDWAWIYRELATTPSLAVRHCYDGQLDWCWEAMGISEGEDQGVDWYSPLERRELVESRFGHYLRRGDYSYYGRYVETNSEYWRVGNVRSLLVHGCVVLGSDKACRLVLEGYPEDLRSDRRLYPIPLRVEARSALMAEALAMGGEGAFTRLVADPEASIRDRILLAAGVPADELMARWRSKALAARPDVQAGLLRIPLSPVLWILLFLAFSMRSTRWRLG